jgi:hypothetical protein
MNNITKELISNINIKLKTFNNDVINTLFEVDTELENNVDESKLYIKNIDSESKTTNNIILPNIDSTIDHKN